MANILVIEDDQRMRQLMKYRLEREGHSVTDAPGGREGLEYFAQHPFDLVITDIIMPDQDGIETITALRERNPEIKIIAVSGGGAVSGHHYLALARKLGAYDIIGKPFRWEDMVRVVEHALGSEN